MQGTPAASGQRGATEGGGGSTYKQHPVKSQQLTAQNGKVVATHQPDCAARDSAMVVVTWTVSFSDDSMQESVGYSEQVLYSEYPFADGGGGGAV